MFLEMFLGVDLQGSLYHSGGVFPIMGQND